MGSKLIHIKFISSGDDYHATLLPTDHAWIEVSIEGKTFRVDFGTQPHLTRPSIHINGPILEVDHHSLNALDIFIKEPS